MFRGLLSQNQGVFSRTGGKVGKQHTVRYVPSKLKLHGINDSRVHSCFSQREVSFLACCTLRKLFSRCSRSTWTCWNQDVLRLLFYVSVLHFFWNAPPQLGSQWKVPVNVRNVRICQPNNVMTFKHQVRKPSIGHPNLMVLAIWVNGAVTENPIYPVIWGFWTARLQGRMNESRKSEHDSRLLGDTLLNVLFLSRVHGI